MDKLKQWIVNLDRWSDEERLKGREDSGPVQILRIFFEIVGTITKGMEVQRAEVTSNFEVKVHTKDDGVLPIEALSQGMTSLYSWVGILVQRLFEIYDTAEHPTHHHALVLMDEIDAHMHPAWQQILVSRLKEIFPRVQMIVTTHSPLIVGGMKPSEVVRLARDSNGHVTRVPVDEEMLLGRTDQVLTSELFSLATTLDDETRKRIEEYRQLLGKTDLSQADKERLAELERLVEHRVPPSAPALLERRAQALLESVYVAAQSLSEDAGSIKKDLLEKAERVSRTLSGLPGDPGGGV